MKKETWVEIFNQVSTYMETYPSQRLGQAICNVLSTKFQTAKDLVGSDVDCFYQDHLIISFIEEFLKREDVVPIFPYQQWYESKLSKYPLKNE